VLSSGGAFLLAGALLLTLVNLLVALRWGKRAGPNPWGSRSFEWLTPTLPPKHNFPETPIIGRGPYDYHLEEKADASPAPR
jgi:cytochrome c oxidase subunit I